MVKSYFQLGSPFKNPEWLKIQTLGLILASYFKVSEDKCENLPGTALYLVVPEEVTKKLYMFVVTMLDSSTIFLL